MKNSSLSQSNYFIFAFSGVITIAALAYVLFGMGVNAVFVTLILIVVEVMFSFENAILNARVLTKMSPAWQRAFLTVGIIFAIFIVRLVLPIVIVALAAHISFDQVIDLALHHPEEYAHKLELAHPVISSFGAGFLLMLATTFFLDNKKQIHWFGAVEKRLSENSRTWLPLVFCIGFIGIWSVLPMNKHPMQTFISGLVGILLYLVIFMLTKLLEKLHDSASTVHMGLSASLVSFAYLEILDSSFSLDGVIGAFAITSQIALIAIGLGVGAFWVRSLTIYMVRKKTLKSYKYLEHGAHYTVGLLAITLLISLLYDIPTFIVGIVGVMIIFYSVYASKKT